MNSALTQLIEQEANRENGGKPGLFEVCVEFVVM